VNWVGGGSSIRKILFIILMLSLIVLSGCQNNEKEICMEKELEPIAITFCQSKGLNYTGKLVANEILMPDLFICGRERKLYEGESYSLTREEVENAKEKCGVR